MTILPQMENNHSGYIQEYRGRYIEYFLILRNVSQRVLLAKHKDPSEAE